MAYHFTKASVSPWAFRFLLVLPLRPLQVKAFKNKYCIVLSSLLMPLENIGLQNWSIMNGPMGITFSSETIKNLAAETERFNTDCYHDEAQIKKILN